MLFIAFFFFLKVGGETAEMPEMYPEGEYDLAGFAVGAVEKNHLMPRINDMKINDIVIGLPSSGIHSNGFSLVRKIMKLADKSYADQAPFSNKTFGKYIYVKLKKKKNNNFFLEFEIKEI